MTKQQAERYKILHNKFYNNQELKEFLHLYHSQMTEVTLNESTKEGKEIINLELNGIQRLIKNLDRPIEEPKGKAGDWVTEQIKKLTNRG